jgi:peroxidase
LNIQRGRDHGLSSYVETRLAIGLSGMTGFDNVTADVKLQNRLKSMYLGVNDIDLWVGGLAESPLPGAMVGETFHKILADQFRRLRDGDRFWYANHLPMPMIQWLEDQTLAKVIRRNTTIGSEISDDVFRVNGDVPIGQIIILLLDELDQ